MRILEIETFGRGGLIHYAYNLSCALASRGHDVTLVTTVAYELEGRSLPPNLRVVKAIGPWTQRIATWPKVLQGIARKLEAILDAWKVAVLARRLGPDVVHIHCTNPVSLVYHVFLRCLGLRLTATAHVVTPHERIGLQSLVYRVVHRSCHLVIAHSEFDRQRLLNEFAVDQKRTVVIPHGEYGFFASHEHQGADRDAARQALGLAADQQVALFFGYIREYKGLDLLLEAWPTVQEQQKDTRLVIAGDPVRLSASRRAELEEQAETVGAVHHFGYVPFEDVARYFAAADVLVMPYRHISQSGVLYLALALGVPVLATRVGALPEMLVDGESAVLVPPESPDALAEGLLRLFGDSALRERLAAGGKHVAESHSWPAIAQRTETAFDK